MPAALDVPAASLAGRPFGIYLHVPFCATRCGYCDFNTYTPQEAVAGSPATFVAAAEAELELAVRVLPAAPPVSTVFFGGGTPTLLAVGELVRLLRRVSATFGLAPGVEVTTEANPESVDDRTLSALREAGFTRLSLGLQSVRPHVLATLDRRHTPGQAVRTVARARTAGFEQVSVDLIYGTPGESAADWQASLDAAVGAGVDHVSAYALIVEPGTALARRIGRGELPRPDDDEAADRYQQADRTLRRAGLSWYELSNWAAGSASRCRHNELYWTGGNWWGVGPGAHSHLDGLRWWNVKHPRRYAGLLGAGEQPVEGHERLTGEQQRVERIMLGLRRRAGVAHLELRPAGVAAARRAVAAGLLRRREHAAGRAALTLRGRLVADAVVRDLVD